jgi:hypothetical protein
MGFETLSTAVNESTALAPITAEEVKFRDEQLADDKALGLVTTDADLAARFVSSKGLSASWNQNDDDFRALVPAQDWPGSPGKKRANLSMPQILEVIESLLPQIFLAFFSDKTPFILTAQGTTDPKAARAASKILTWAIKKSGFKEAIRQILKSCLLYGTGIGKWSGEKGTTRKKTYSQSAEGVVAETKEVPYFCPKFERADLRNVLVDPALRTSDIRDAKYVIFQSFITANDLDDLRADETYKNVPTRAQLKEILAAKSEGTTDSVPGTKIESFRENQAERQTAETSSDPLQQPLELLEYWTKDRVITVLQRKIVIRNDENDDTGGFVSESFIDVLNAFYGFGIGFLLLGEQKLQAGVANLWLDFLALKLNPMFHRRKGVGAGSQNIQAGPGKVVNDDGELVPLELTQNISAESLQALAVSESRARRRVGANFGPDMPTQAMRTAEGVQEFTAGIETRTQYFVERFADNVFIPGLEALLCLCKDNMTPADIDRVLTEEEGAAFQGNHLDFYNGLYGIQVLSSTKLAAKRAMIGMVTPLLQLFQAAPVQQSLLTQAKKIDYAELLNQVIELVGWESNGLIVDATPEDLARAQQLNPAAIKAQSDMARTQVEHQNDLELESAKGDVRAGIQVVKHVLDQSAAENEPEKPLATRSSKE